MGVIPEKRVELTIGEIITMPPIGSKYAACANKIVALLHKILQDKYMIGSQNPVQLNNLLEPKPDISILNFRDDFYASAHPKTKDVLMLIEVADSSLNYDKSLKSKLYAEAGIAEYLIINLEESQIEFYQNPKKRKVFEVEYCP